MTFPNLIIGGAPKCGTTSLFRWLADHPQVATSNVKETFFLMDHGHSLARPESNYHQHGLAAYEEFFAAASTDRKVLLEATTHYLYQQTAFDVLSTLPSEPQIIFVLREPAGRIYSDYRYKLNNQAFFRENISFAQFIDLFQNAPRERIEQAVAVPPDLLLNVIEQSNYVEFLPKWIERFGSQRVHVLLLEEIRQDPRVVMKRLAEAIDIDSDFFDDYSFVATNRSVQVRNPHLHRIARKLGGVFPNGSWKRWIRSTYRRAFTTARNSIPPEDERVLAELRHHFDPLNQQLASELSLDLSRWQAETTAAPTI